MRINDADSPAFAAVIGMLLIAFLILIFSALLYASGPNAPVETNDTVIRSLSHLLANMCGCLGLAVSWLALVPFLRLLSLNALAEAFTWVLLSVTISAASWVALFAYHLTLAPVSACLALPVIGITLPALYRLGAARMWPASDPVLHYAFVALGVSGLIFAAHLALLAACGQKPAILFLQRNGHVINLAQRAAYAVAVGFTWFAVAAP